MKLTELGFALDVCRRGAEKSEGNPNGETKLTCFQSLGEHLRVGMISTEFRGFRVVNLQKGTCERNHEATREEEIYASLR